MICGKCKDAVRIGGCALTHKNCDSCGKDVLYATTATDLLCDECSVQHSRCKVCGFVIEKEEKCMNIIEFGDCRETMRRWSQQGIKAQMCVTSPPYFGLRDYGHGEQLGIEETPEQYAENLVEVFGVVRDLLADDGTLWLNLGDSYARAGGWSDNHGLSKDANGIVPPRGESGRAVSNFTGDRRSQKVPKGYKQKDLLGIPWLVAFALRSSGWFLRQEIIWHKPNGVPERLSLGRCAKSHEHIFLLSKSSRYYFDGEAIAASALNGKPKARGSVWSVPVKPYKGAHFATFPPALIEPCILAGSRPGDIVLDPFMGSGTTAAVALQNGRQYLGCELNPDYGPLQKERIVNATPSSPHINLLA